jgi:hypothetical protein
MIAARASRMGDELAAGDESADARSRAERAIGLVHINARNGSRVEQELALPRGFSAQAEMTNGAICATRREAGVTGF